MNFPTYITENEVQNQAVKYKWDSWKAHELIGPPNDDIISCLQTLSSRARYALMIGSAEWVIYRFAQLFEEKLPYYVVEAAWAQVIDFRYGFIEEFESEDWQGPVKGPLLRLMIWIQDCADYLDKNVDFSASVEEMYRLGYYVVENKDAYKTWFISSIERLHSYFPIKDNDVLGDPVPRVALDPNFVFNSEDIEPLINQYLRKLDPEKNWILNSAEDMKNEGFELTPYAFDLENDRKTRSKKS